MPETSVIVGASLAFHFFVGPGRSSLGPSSCPDSPKCVEKLFGNSGLPSVRGATCGLRGAKKP